MFHVFRRSDGYINAARGRVPGGARGDEITVLASYGENEWPDCYDRIVAERANAVGGACRCHDRPLDADTVSALRDHALAGTYEPAGAGIRTGACVHDVLVAHTACWRCDADIAYLRRERASHTTTGRDNL